MAARISVDVVIFGGGIAGLWLLDHLVRAGHHAILLEANQLGAGQTIASQGIIHGGLKYTLDGLFNPSAEAIREMPDRWRACLSGEALPDLKNATVRADFCYLWRTSGLRSQLGMLGARVGLRIKPEKLPLDQWPAALHGLSGEVFRLDEQVLDPATLLDALARPHAQRLLRFQSNTLAAVDRSDAEVQFQVTDSDANQINFSAQRVVLAAGAGNAALLTQFGLAEPKMQRRPLHMAMLRGPLPWLNGHCTDASTTRVTISSARDAADRIVWQVGGQVAEDGVQLERPALILHAARELRAVVPNVDFAAAEWSTYRVDRAEPATRSGRRPEDASCNVNGPIITAWPTKLALAPRLAEQVAQLLPSSKRQTNSDELAGLARPTIARPPWETETEWSSVR